MTNEELVQKIKEGRTELIPELWTQVEAFVQSYAHKFITFRQTDNCAKAGIEQEDLYQAGYFALEPAIKAYEPEKGFKFLTYFTRHLLNVFYKEIKVHKSGDKWYNNSDVLASSESIDKSIYEDKNGTELTVADVTPDEDAEAQFESFEEEQYNQQLRADLEEAISSLNQRDAQIIRDYYFNDLSTDAQALKLGIGISRVSTLRNRALAKLRTHKALALYREEIMGLAYKSSVGAFKNTGSSSTERILLKLEAYEYKLGLK